MRPRAPSRIATSQAHSGCSARGNRTWQLQPQMCTGRSADGQQLPRIPGRRTRGRSRRGQQPTSASKWCGPRIPPPRLICLDTNRESRSRPTPGRTLPPVLVERSRTNCRSTRASGDSGTETRYKCQSHFTTSIWVNCMCRPEQPLKNWPSWKRRYLVAL